MKLTRLLFAMLLVFVVSACSFSPYIKDKTARPTFNVIEDEDLKRKLSLLAFRIGDKQERQSVTEYHLKNKEDPGFSSGTKGSILGDAVAGQVNSQLGNVLGVAGIGLDIASYFYDGQAIDTYGRFFLPSKLEKYGDIDSQNVQAVSLEINNNRAIAAAEKLNATVRCYGDCSYEAEKDVYVQMFVYQDLPVFDEYLFSPDSVVLYAVTPKFEEALDTDIALSGILGFTPKFTTEKNSRFVLNVYGPLSVDQEGNLLYEWDEYLGADVPQFEKNISDNSIGRLIQTLFSSDRYSYYADSTPRDPYVVFDKSMYFMYDDGPGWFVSDKALFPIQ